jgi:hypothetical protein
MPINAMTRRSALAWGAGALTACAPQERAVPPVQSGGVCWTPLLPLAHAVQEIYPAAHKGRIHVSGGLLGQDGRVAGVSPHHMAYDPRTGASAALAPCPGVRHHPQLVSQGGRLYQLGGFSGRDGAVAWIMTGDTFLYDEAANSWMKLADAPAAHAECVAARLDGNIHLAGGRAPKGEANAAYGDHADTTQHLVFDPGANAWSSAAPALTARNSAAGALIDGLWHVAGGRSMAGGPSDAHEVYDPKEDRWRAAAPMPKGSGAGGNAAGAIGGMLYVFGGEWFEPRPGGVHRAVWRYAPKADAWEQVSEMPTPRHGLGGVVLDDAIYLVGGATQPSGVGTSAVVERFKPGC